MIEPARRRRATPPPAPRFDKERWLEAALEVLAREGQAKFDVKRIAAQLGVTKGSFYYHFGSRDAFVTELLRYWRDVYTESVKVELTAARLNASDSLLMLMELIERDDLDRYDVAIRSWAAQDPKIAAEVKKVDASRREFVEGLFAGMGFDGAERQERACAWLVYYTGNRSAFMPEQSRDDPERIMRLHALFTRPTSED